MLENVSHHIACDFDVSQELWNVQSRVYSLIPSPPKARFSINLCFQFQGMSLSIPETLYHRDDALLYIAYVMLIWAAPIPADR